MRAVALRDLTFAACALAFGVTQPQGRRRGWADGLVTLVRVAVGGVLVFFAVVHLLHPDSLRGCHSRR